MKLIVGISGASGVIYGIRILEVLREAVDVETHLVTSEAAKVNIKLETEYELNDVEALADVVHPNHNLAATISSGSFRTDGMIIAPCSIKTLSAVVHSYTDNLLTRAADVVLKEGRKLVLMPRETPLHVGHCKLLHEAAEMGVKIFPPLPSFYTKPTSVDDIINHSVGRALDLFDIDTSVVKRWQGA